MKIIVTPPTIHYVLVDYDNLVKNTNMRVESLYTILSHIVSSLAADSDFFSGCSLMQRISIRLYGGWFIDRMPTHLAQSLIRTISSCRGFNIVSVGVGLKVRLDVELAYGLLSLGKYSFYGTLRKYQPKFVVRDILSRRSCDVENVLHSSLTRFFEDGRCAGCERDLRPDIYIESQKLVDTMMACDLQWLTGRDSVSTGGVVPKKVAVVTSDNDLIPPIYQQSLSSDTVYHVLTKGDENYCFANFYSALRPKNYKCIPLKIGE